MNPRLMGAQVASAAATWALADIFHRPAANFPGKLGLYINPRLIADLRSHLRESAIVVTGTNGKTTVTNLLADALEAAGKSVACNRTGANLDSGVATALLHANGADWGVFESDELWLAKILNQLQPDFVVLLNLFRDQLDRMGEIEHMQASIAAALASSPDTVLIYNSDDPLCQAIADQVANRHISFGIDEDLGLVQNTVADASMCQHCDALLDYEWRQYGQLGSFSCPSCEFKREAPAFAARGVTIDSGRATFTFHGPKGDSAVESPFPGTYMLYNVVATYAAASCCGAPIHCVHEVVRSFDPHNGRLQRYDIDGRSVLLNLAKNPTGFNQNLRIVLEKPGPKAVAFFINDKEADGHDVSWLWDIDFQELANSDELLTCAGGIRSKDMQVRLKYAGVNAELVDGVADFLSKAHAASPHADLFLIANYTALPTVKEELDHLQARADQQGQRPSRHGGKANKAPSAQPRDARSARIASETDAMESKPGRCPAIPKTSAGYPDALCNEKLMIAHLYPELLNLYGDGGNVTVLAYRARQRGIETRIEPISHGSEANLENADIVFIGGGPDREQRLASRDLLNQAEQLRSYVEDDGVLLAICGGYQILGHEWLLENESVAGLGIVDIVTKRAEGGSHNRLVGNIALHSPLASVPVIGYENHAGRTYLGRGCEPFGCVVGKHGRGNNGVDGTDGVRYRNVVGTYLHGPLLSKNPEVADWLIGHALKRRAMKEGRQAPDLSPLDDTCERAANEFMCVHLGLHRQPNGLPTRID